MPSPLSNRLDDVERAHLLDPADRSFTIARFEPTPALAPLVRRYWVPTWRVPPGEERVQRVLQYPSALVVVAERYSRFYGVTEGLSTTVLTGTSWAFGVMLRASAGHLLTGRPMTGYRSTHVPLAEAWRHGEALTAGIRAELAPAPTDPERQRRAAALLEHRLTELLPVGEEAELVDAVVDLAEGKPDLVRVADLADAVALTERSLQRLTSRWLGLSPKWLLQRRRLQEAAERLRSPVPLATLAAELGYVDQAHLARDWRRVTGLTPREFAQRFTRPDPPG